MNAIRSILQRNNWSINYVATAAAFLLAPTSAYLLINYNDTNKNLPKVLHDGRSDDEEQEELLKYVITNTNANSNADKEDDNWTDKSIVPDAFWKEFVFTSSKPNETSCEEPRKNTSNTDEAAKDPNTSSTLTPGMSTIDLFKALFPPFSQEGDSDASSSSKNTQDANSKNMNNASNDYLPNFDDLIESTVSSMTETFTELLTGQVSDRTFNELISHARNKSQTNSSSTDIELASKSFSELINIFMNDIEKVQQSLTRNFVETFDNLDFVDPTSIFYYLEQEDENKNPSWKRRMHRFCRGVDLNQVNYLNDALKLAELSYADTVEEIKDTLESGKLQIGGNPNANIDDEKNERYELIHCQLESYPGKPSHYLAVKRDQSIWSPSLEVLLVVRGTKTVPDMLTDALLDAEDYKDGKAHAGILESGKYLVEKHSPMMESLLKKSKKKQIKLFIVGHSLGAGASTIAGMELHDHPSYDVSVVGFGCPALLSKDLSSSASSYVTTVIGDADIVPRMSAATLGNVILNILEYDWTSKAKRDVEHALQELFFQNAPFLFSKDTIQSIRQSVDTQIMNFVKTRIKSKTEKRVEPTLFPPGNCIHFYRDGIAVSGAFTPATFFREIDISRTMVDDHSIGGYRRIFLDVMRNFHGDDHFSFEQRKGR